MGQECPACQDIYVPAAKAEPVTAAGEWQAFEVALNSRVHLALSLAHCENWRVGRIEAGEKDLPRKQAGGGGYLLHIV